MLLSIIIPVFNECGTIPIVLPAIAAVLPDVEKQVVVVDDGSTDGTREWLRTEFPDGTGRIVVPGGATMEIRVLYHDGNRGKGAALRTGFAAAAGDVLVVQDADLEYDPHDWRRMYDLIMLRGTADVVYGCRFYGEPHRSLYFHHFLANRLISLLFNILYNQTLMDIEVCYKMFRREVIADMPLTCTDFGIEIELSAKIAMSRRWRIYEIGISYFGRTYAEGKKIKWQDGVKALWYLLKFRLAA
jgi:glycosyltransferase involved in cell wall biosynthesis